MKRSRDAREIKRDEEIAREIAREIKRETDQERSREIGTLK